ncbi:2'-5' RNA ligase family protein [Terrisporobacter petrolearius]|uniref:2'-5' RNA ligase family protein n=1 Tax=Terrisporobacter petrolearius TaxID=1460447 RepID=UPI003B00EAE6
MRYVIVSVVKGEAGNFNNKLRKEVYEIFKAKSSKLPAHFTIKSPFEEEDIKSLEEVLETFVKNNKKANYILNGYDHFDDRVIFMKVNMSDEAKKLHDKLIDELSKINYINFTEKDGKNKIFHVTVSSKKIQKIYKDLWNYVNQFPFKFHCEFDNICIYKWEDNTWKLHKEYFF